MQFVIKMKDKDSIWNVDLDNLLKVTMGLNIDIVNISKLDKYFYILVNTEKTKVNRLVDFCKNYMSFYNRTYTLRDLDLKLKSGKIDQIRYDVLHKALIAPIEIEIIYREKDILPIEEQRDDKITEILS